MSRVSRQIEELGVSDEMIGRAQSAFAVEVPAESIARKLEFHDTPKHGRWLNRAEIELSVLGDQCLDRRLPDIPAVRTEVAAWQAPRNAAHVTINWRFDAQQARAKLRRLYPS